MDINQGPLTRAERISKRMWTGGENRDTAFSDGLEKMKKGEADTVLIAGMGRAFDGAYPEQQKGGAGRRHTCFAAAV